MPPMRGAPHRTTDAHTSAAHDGSLFRSRRDTTSRSHRGRPRGWRHRPVSSARRPQGLQRCGRAGIEHAAGRLSPLVPERDARAPRRTLDRDGRDYARPHRQRTQPCGGAAVGRMRPKGAPAATHLRPQRPNRVANRGFPLRSRSHLCAALFPAQRDFSRPCVPSLLSGGGGNRTRVRGRTGQSIYERSSPWISPDGRWRTTYRRASPPLDVAPWASGSPVAPSPMVGALP
jgi:hypothetical protein